MVEGGLRLKREVKRDSAENPLVSIITPCFNGESFLEKTIQSVLGQQYENVEYIVVDGGSSDSTLDILSKYQDRVDYFISEPDSGMYEAIDKGFKLASGSIFAWINADDMYYPYTIQTIVRVFNNLKEVSWISGVPSIIDETGAMINVEAPKSYQRNWIRKGYQRGDVAGFLQQESMFFRSAVYKRYPLNTSLKLAGDYHLWKDFAKSYELYTVKSVLSSFRVSSNQLSQDIEAYYSECNDPGSLMRALSPLLKLFCIIDRRKHIKLI